MPGPDPLDANTALVERFFDAVMNGRNPQQAAQLLTPDFVAHHSMLPQGKGGAADVAKLLKGFRDGFPDLHYDVEDHVAQADKVATRWVATGTNSGSFQGMPPTGKHVSVGGTDIFRIANGRIAETWVCSDMLGLLQQLGVIQAPPAAQPAPAGP